MAPAVKLVPLNIKTFAEWLSGAENVLLHIKAISN
jgi:hypothetical protein